MMSREAVAEMLKRDKVEARTREILDLLQEECGELVQVVSKCRRFGLEENRERLVQEIADVSLLIDLLHAYELYTDAELNHAKNSKSQKLAKYSRIYED